MACGKIADLEEEINFPIYLASGMFRSNATRNQMKSRFWANCVDTIVQECSLTDKNSSSFKTS